MQRLKKPISSKAGNFSMRKKYQIILLALAEQGKEHGYFVLAGREHLRICVSNFTVFLRSRKEHGYFVLAIPF